MLEWLGGGPGGISLPTCCVRCALAQGVGTCTFTTTCVDNSSKHRLNTDSQGALENSSNNIHTCRPDVFLSAIKDSTDI